MNSIVLFGAVVLLGVAVRGHMDFTVDYSDCYGESEGESPQMTFDAEQLDFLLSDIFGAIWIASPNYIQQNELYPPIHCRDIHIQGSGTSVGNAVDCNATVTYQTGSDPGCSDLVNKFLTVYNSCTSVDQLDYNYIFGIIQPYCNAMSIPP